MAFDPSTATLTAAPATKPAFDPASAQLTTPPKAGPKLNGVEQMIVDATQGPHALLGTQGPIMSGIHAAVNDGTFGLTDKAAAATYAALSQHPAGQALLKAIGAGSGQPATYAQAKAAAADVNTQSQQNHPVANIVGDVAGAFTGGGLISDAAKAAEAAPVIGKTVAAAGRILAPAAKVQGEGVVNGLARAAGNVAKSAGEGAVIGGGTEALQGGNADQVGEAAVAGAALNPLATKGVSMVLQKVQPVVSQSMKILASKLGETPETLQAAFDNFKSATGQTPPLSAIVGLKSQGQLAELAAGHSTIGEAVSQAADTQAQNAASTLPGRIEQITGNQPQSVADLLKGRAASMDTAMDAVRDEPVFLDQSHAQLLNDPRLRKATADDPNLRARLNKASDNVSSDMGESNGDLSVGDVDDLRKAIGQMQPNSPNPQAMGALRTELTALADTSSAGPQYRAALEQFGNASKYISGFKHGMAGKDVSAAEGSAMDALGTPHGQQGYQSGLATRLQNTAGDTLQGAQNVASAVTEPGMQATLAQTFSPGQAQQVGAAGQATSDAQKALNNIAPSRIAPEQEGSGVQAGQAAGALMSHSPAGTLFHLTRAMPELMGKLSPKVQETISRYLTDPTMAQQGINLLKKAGAKQQDLRNLATAIGSDMTAQTAPATTGQGQ